MLLHRPTPFHRPTTDTRDNLPPAALRPALAPTLEHLFETFPYASRLPADPLQFVHLAKTPADREIVALLASALAYGRADVFRLAIQKVLAHMETQGGPAQYIHQFEWEHERAFLEGFRYRMTSGKPLGALFFALRQMLETHGSLEQAFCAHFEPSHPDIGPALSGWVQDLYRWAEPVPDRAFKHLLPDPALGSACKRLNLFLRWMVRHQPVVDLGQWTQVPTSHLILPLDTHTLRMSYNLGLTRRRDQSWRTAVEVTQVLRSLDAQDPVKYDFALCHLGMAGDCPARQQESICGRCQLQGLCRWW